MSARDRTPQGFASVPANRFLGLRLVSRSAEEAVITMEVAPDHIQETGVVHGGILSAAADTAAVYLFHPDLADTQSMASIEFKMNFLRPATADGGPVPARSRLLRRGRKVGVCEVELTQADQVVAKGLFTYLFIDRSERGGRTVRDAP